MAEHLFIRMGEQSDQATLVALNDEGHLLEGPQTVALAAVAEKAAGRQATVLLPASEIVTCLAKVPAASPSRLRQMLPFSLEDDFAGDVDDLHFAAGSRTEDDALSVSVIGRQRMNFWLDTLKLAGIEARRISSEADGVPDTPGAVTLFLEGRKILGRRAGGAPFCFDELSLAELWQLLAAEREDDKDMANVVCFVDRATDEQRRQELDSWRKGQGEAGFDVNIKELADGCLTKLAAGMVFKPGTNLLQGDYATRSNITALARPWRAAASIALIFVAFNVLGKGIEFYKLDRDQDRLDAEATAVCSESYGSPQLSRCLVEMGRRLADHGQTAAAGGEGFLSMLAAIAESLEPAMSIEAISFRDGTMTLELITPNISYLEAFDQRLTGSGQFALDVQTTQEGSDGSLNARVRIVAQS